ncbi:MAG: multiheme c-type cytochrome [Thermodesulfobacteriota bacterium]
MRSFSLALGLLMAAFFSAPALAQEAAVSAATEACLECHRTATPGVVTDWLASRHRRVSPAQALMAKEEARLFSATAAPEHLAGFAVGCAECHTLNAEAHGDTFEHEGQKVHVVVTPKDCAVCHPAEAEQYDQNKMARAYGNLQDNPLYVDLAAAINRVAQLGETGLGPGAKDEADEQDSCLQCHGAKVEMTGLVTRGTDLGDFELPVLAGWPNQGVGRINPDQSRGSCASCHPRHAFSIKVARQPYTCAQCHQGPDSPAYKVFAVSKHGNIFSSLKDGWNWEAVPWTAGGDFTAPTCAVCHVALIKDAEGETVAARTHQVSDRLPWRLFGLPYAHPQTKDPDTSKIRNKGGLPLPTELTGEPAADFLIEAAVMADRTKAMQRVCQACHATGWTENHWARFEHTLKVTNDSTLTATKIMSRAWEQGAAKGPGAGESPFDETLERLWVQHWLFLANSVRLAAAMGGADYGVFADGRWALSRNLQEMADWLGFKLSTQGKTVK